MASGARLRRWRARRVFARGRRVRRARTLCFGRPPARVPEPRAPGPEAPSRPRTRPATLPKETGRSCRRRRCSDGCRRSCISCRCRGSSPSCGRRSGRRPRVLAEASRRPWARLWRPPPPGCRPTARGFSRKSPNLCRPDGDPSGERANLPAKARSCPWSACPAFSCGVDPTPAVSVGSGVDRVLEHILQRRLVRGMLLKLALVLPSAATYANTNVVSHQVFE